MSPRIAPSDWPRLLTLFEQALDLPASGREAWVQGLDLPDALATALRGLLDERHAVEAGDFLAALPGLSVNDVHIRPRFVEGALIGPWRLLRELGQGGMSVVWLAQRHDGQVERTVAIKLPHAGPGQDLLARRMLRERSILAALEHPHIGRLYDVGITDDGVPYLVMEYVAGVNLLDHAEARRLGIRERVALFQQVLAAVQFAHGKLVLHRDLKPSNILVGADGHVKLLDFGIAKLMTGDGDADEHSELTRGADRQLTPSYASPEQIQGQTLGTASDVYSLGVILYELLCGHRPHASGTGSAAQLEAAVLNEEAPAPSKRPADAATLDARSTTAKALTRALRGDLDAIVLKAMAKVPEQRYASAEALHADLRHWLEGGPVSARGPGFWYPVGKFVRRHRVGLGAGGLAVTTLIAAGAVAIVQSRMASQEADRAAAARDFMLQLFDESDPNRLGGVELTTTQRLELGRLKAESHLGEQGSLQAELLAGIGQAQYRARDMVSADAALSRAADYFQAHGDKVREADARITRLRIAVDEGNFDTVDGPLRELEPLQTTIGHDAVLRLRWLVAHGHYARLTRNWDAAVSSLEQCLALADLKDPKQVAAAFDAHALLAEMLMENGELDKVQGHLKAAARLPAADQELPAAERALRLAVASIRAEANQGRHGAASRLLPAVITECEASFGSRSLRCASLKITLLNAYMFRGDTERMQPLIAQGEWWLQQNLSPRARVSGALLLTRALAVIGITDSTRLPNIVLEKAVAPDAKPALPMPTRLQGLVTLAEVRLRAGDPVAAKRLLDQTEPLAEQAGGERALAQWHLQLARGLALQAAGNDIEALVAMKRICAVAPLDSAWFQLPRLNCVRSLVLSQEKTSAIRLLQEAMPALIRDLGDDAPNTQRARRLLEALQSPAGWRPPPWNGGQIFVAF